MIYADNASTTKICASALEAVNKAYRELYANPSALHSEGEKARDAIENARAVIAGCLNAQPDEIFFTSGGTESDETALLSAVRASGKHHIISTQIEHPAVLETLSALEQKGFSVTLLPPESDGVVSTERIKKAITPETALVSVMYANNETGAIQEIKEIGSLCREKEILFHTDAVHAAGHVPIDVQNDNMDMLSASAHKFGGPRGTGILYIRNNIPRYPLILGGGQEKGLRSGTENAPSILGTAAALKEKTDRMTENTARTLRLRQILMDGIAAIPGAHINSTAGHCVPGTLNVRFDGINSEALAALMDANGIEISTCSACSAGKVKHSRTLLAMGLAPAQAENSVRISVNEDNTEDEMHIITKTLSRITGSYSG